MKAVTIRMPDELLDALRKKAAEETIRRNKQVSINTMAVKILTQAVEKKKKGG